MYPRLNGSSASPRIESTRPSSTSTTMPHAASHSGHVAKCRVPDATVLGASCRVVGLPLTSSRPAFLDDRKSRQDLFVQHAHVPARLLVARSDFCAQVGSNCCDLCAQFVARRLNA